MLIRMLVSPLGETTTSIETGGANILLVVKIAPDAGGIFNQGNGGCESSDMRWMSGNLVQM